MYLYRGSSEELQATDQRPKTQLKSPEKQLLGSSKMKIYNTAKIFPENAQIAH